MRILLLTPIYPPTVGGPASYAREISERLTPQHSVSVVAYAPKDAVPYGQATLKIISGEQPLPLRLLRFTFAALRASKSADVIYAQNAVAAGLPAVIAGMLSRKPVIIKVVGDEAWERATQAGITTQRLEDFYTAPRATFRIKFLMWLQGFVLRRATIVTTPSRYLGAELSRAYRIPSDRVIPNFNATEYVSKGDVVRKKHSLVVTARLTAWKGIDGIIRALSALRRDFPDATLTIAGDGPERVKLESLSNDLNLSSTVTFLGNIPHKEVRTLLTEADVFVLNSTYEGLPHSVLDAFAARCPVVATDISGTNEVVKDHENGLSVPPGDDKRLIEAIHTMFTDHELRSRLVEGAQHTALDVFSWSGHIVRLERLFDEAKKRKK